MKQYEKIFNFRFNGGLLFAACQNKSAYLRDSLH